MKAMENPGRPSAEEHQAVPEQSRRGAGMKKGWPWKPLGEICRTGSGGTPLSSRKEYYEGGTIPWLVSGDVSQGNVWETQRLTALYEQKLAALEALKKSLLHQAFTGNL